VPAESPPQLDALLMDVLARRPDERAAYLKEACGGDQQLRNDLEELLRLHEQAGNFLENPAVALPERRDLADIGERLGSFIGRYKLLEHIGEGGFGSVFMAEQEQPVRRKVALKVIKLGMDTRQVVARFEAERQALAMMDHPNIARVLDGGATESGRPYFVMELVRGTPITGFCDEHRLTVRERLDLFVQVCSAVQHAHTKGVIHRDLKPSNILAVSHDGTPTVKVIDFGIVKAIGANEPLTDKTLFTEFRQLIGTPAYMSPEQAGQSDIDVDTRSDIYSLGVLLYELLTGTTPFDAKSLQSGGLDEMRRVIREVEPPKPSTRLNSLSESRSASGSSLNAAKPIAGMRGSVPDRSDSSSITLANVAAQRHSEPMTLVRQLHGDLDWIVMSCLEKDRARRYETASALAADVQRHLGGDPVVAAPPSRWYRLSKALRRYKTAVVIVAGFVAVITAGLVATGIYWRAEFEQRGRAEAIKSFLSEMLTATDPAKSKGAKVTVREALDQAARRIDEGALRDQPIVDAEVRYTIGSTYHALGLFPEAETQLRAADVLQARELGPEHPDTLRTRTKLAEALWYKCDYAGVADIAEPTMLAQRRVLGEDHPDTLKSTVLLGRVLWGKPGKYAEAESLLSSAIERLERVRGHDHPDTADALDGLGELYSYNAYRERAEPLHREALRIHTKWLGEEHPVTLYSMFFLAHTLDARSSDAMHRKCYELRLRVLGPNHVDTLASQQSVANTLNRQSRFAEAEPLLRESLAAHLRIAPNYVNTIHAYHFLAWCLENQGKYAEAEVLLRQGLDAAIKQFGPEDSDTTIRLMCKLAQLLARAQKDSDAEQVAREVLAIQHRQTPRPPPQELTQSSLALVEVLQRRGADQEAIQVERELIDFWLTEARAPNAAASTLHGAARRLLHAANTALRDPPQALQLALQANQRSARPNPKIMQTLALSYFQQGDAENAVKWQKTAIELLPPDAASRSECEARLAEYERR